MVVDQKCQEETVEVGTPRWDQITQRRAELIFKKNRQGLSEEEQSEFEVLQRLSREAITRKFPHPQLTRKVNGKLA